MEKGQVKKFVFELGMQTFDQALFDLLEADVITYEDALRNNGLSLKIKLDGKASHGKDMSFGLDGFGIV